jgi:hypothetical protein
MNMIGDEAIKALAKPLSLNTCLHTLNLKDNSFTNDSMTEFLENLFVNNTLTKLNIDRNNLSQRMYQRASKIIARNILISKGEQIPQMIDEIIEY